MRCEAQVREQQLDPSIHVIESSGGAIANDYGMPCTLPMATSNATNTGAGMAIPMTEISELQNEDATGFDDISATTFHQGALELETSQLVQSLDHRYTETIEQVL